MEVTLTRKKGERIMVGDGVKITVLDIGTRAVKLLIETMNQEDSTNSVDNSSGTQTDAL